MPLPATQATQPIIGSPGETPTYPYLFAVDQSDYRTASVNFTAQEQIANTSVMFSLNLPKLALDPTSTAGVVIIPNVYQPDPGNALVVLASLQLYPEALGPNGWVKAAALQGGQTYTAWRVTAYLKTVNVGSGAQAASFYVGCSALLTVSPQ